MYIYIYIALSRPGRNTPSSAVCDGHCLCNAPLHNLSMRYVIKYVHVYVYMYIYHMCLYIMCFKGALCAEVIQVSSLLS